MTRINEMNEEVYISLVNQALKDIDKYQLDKKSPAEVVKFGENRIEELKFADAEAEKIYIANLLMPNIEEFKKMRSDNGNIINVVADKTGIPSQYIMTRIYEINKYGKYLKGEKNMENMEIIDGSNEAKQPFKSVEEETKVAVAKINELLNLNEHKSETINRQATSIDQLNARIIQLEEEVKDKNEQLTNQGIKVKELESQLFEAHKDIQLLTKYKESYRKILGLLDKPIFEPTKTQVEVKENKQI